NSGKSLKDVAKTPYSGSSSAVRIPANKIPGINNISWSCPKCTFKNKPLVLQCEVCLNIKPDKDQQSQDFVPIEILSSEWDCPMCTYRNEDYCDYCDRIFPDNAEARKNHIEGANHQNNVKLHYDSYKAPIELLLENSKKSPCRKFHETGYCPFGLSCKYSHVPYGIDFSVVDPHLYLAQNPILLQQQRRQAFMNEQGGQSLQQKPTPMFKYKLPAGLSLRDLPPSLRPPPPMGYDFSKAAQWG
ncbi:10143_t:CDS:2, partial [Dentiscutata heterogama]